MSEPTKKAKRKPTYHLDVVKTQFGWYLVTGPIKSARKPSRKKILAWLKTGRHL